MKRAGFLVGLLALSSLMMVGPVSALPISLLPGTTVDLAGAGDTGIPGTIHIFRQLFYGTAGPAPQEGELTELVIRETATGNLDFYFLLENRASSSDAVNKTSNVSFKGFTTSVNWRNDSSGFFSIPDGVAPSSADRSASGNNVSFQFENADGSDLFPGQSSKWFYITTNAPSVTSGITAIIDGNAVNLENFAPMAVPLSPTVLLMGSGLLGLAGWRKVRKC